jgi:hypothetical protein
MAKGKKQSRTKLTRDEKDILLGYLENAKPEFLELAWPTGTWAFSHGEGRSMSRKPCYIKNMLGSDGEYITIQKPKKVMVIKKKKKYFVVTS